MSQVEERFGFVLIEFEDEGQVRQALDQRQIPVSAAEIHIVEAPGRRQKQHKRRGEALDGRIGLEQGTEVEPFNIGVAGGADQACIDRNGVEGGGTRNDEARFACGAGADDRPGNAGGQAAHGDGGRRAATQRTQQSQRESAQGQQAYGQATIGK